MPDAPAAPPVTIVVRTRNRPALLAEALRDIAGQEFTEYEVVVVDDGDDAEAVRRVVGEATTPGDGIRIVDRTRESHGRARAANAGLRAARGRYLVLHDDDDTWAPDFLAVTVAHLDGHPDAGGVSAHTEVVVHRTDAATGEERLERLLLNPGLTAITIADMVRENRVTTHSLLYRASVHDEIGYLDEDLIAHEDWDFYLRFIARFPIDLLPFPARAFWHHRPEATGDEGNSVFVLDADHDAGRVRVRDAHLRASVRSAGLGPALHLASEVQLLQADIQRLREDAAAREQSLSERLERIESLLAALPASIEQVEESVERIPPLVVERTSLGSLVRRARRRVRRE